MRYGRRSDAFFFGFSKGWKITFQTFACPTDFQKRKNLNFSTVKNIITIMMISTLSMNKAVVVVVVVAVGNALVK